MIDGSKQPRLNWARLPFIEVGRRIWHFFGGRLLLGLLAAIGSLLFFMWLAKEVFEGETKHFDENIRQAVQQTASPALTQLMILVSAAGSVAFLTGLAVVVVFIFLRLNWRRGIVLFLITMGGEIILSLTLKGFFQRARPEALHGYPLPASFSFPSGHALASFCFFGILAWLITARLRNFWVKFFIWSGTALLVFFIGVSRIYLGVHFPSDVIAGFAAAFVWTSAVSFSDFWLKKRTASNGSEN